MQKLFRASLVFVGVALAASAFAGCGGSSSTGAAALCSGPIKIVTEFAVSGTDAGAQVPAQNGADLAVQKLGQNLGHGCTLSVKHDNYEGTSGVDPSIAAANATGDVSDASIIAMDGTFNSGAAKVVIPIATRSHLVMISPANTNPGLTLQQYATANGIDFATLHPAGFSEAYYRIPGNDVVQGKVDAQLAAGAPVNAHSVYVIDDDTTYGIGLANYFTQTFQSNGGTVLGRSSITATQASSFPSLAATINSKHPDIVFMGGVTSGGLGLMKKDLVAAGYTGPVVGGDGIAQDPSWFTAAGSAAVNTYGSVMAPDLTALTSGAGAAFKTDYAAAFPGADNTPYAAMSYDATGIIIQAIKNVIASGHAVTREAVRAAVQSISYTGITGNISFDTNGDNAGQKVYSIYGVTPAAPTTWSFISSGNV
jgi:branched-chain amino acid transport system substrate-binding protein